MLIRHNRGNTPIFTFTSDFHELVRGDLICGTGTLRYDPFRIVPADEIPTFSAKQRPVVAQCRFHPEGPAWSKELLFPSATWVQPIWDPTGQGTMLETEIPILAGVTEFEFWFSYTDEKGTERYDSEMGANFFLRFASHDLTIESSKQDNSSGRPTFELSILSVPDIDEITIRWRYTALPAIARQSNALAVSEGPEGRKRWTPPSGSFSVEPDSPIAFDLVYKSGGHTFTDDNDGTWYIVTSPEN
jgi:hypothetical protein